MKHDAGFGSVPHIIDATIQGAADFFEMDLQRNYSGKYLRIAPLLEISGLFKRNKI